MLHKIVAAAQLNLLLKTPKRFGGKQPGAGRPQVNARKSEPHRSRPPLRSEHPIHVTVRVAPAVGALRTHRAYRALRRALRGVLARHDFRVVHVSIQRAHVHFLVEADDERALATGMQALQISAARKLNAEVGRRGNVFVDRYHPEVITSPRQARNALAYVLNNWRRHGEHARALARRWRLDPYSSAIAFRGWRNQPDHWDLPPTYEPLPVCFPQTWLLYQGATRDGPIAITFIPGPRSLRTR
jgi:putative transposase